MGCGGGRRRRHRRTLLGGCGIPIPPLYSEPDYYDQGCQPAGPGQPQSEEQYTSHRPDRQPPAGSTNVRPDSALADSVQELRRKQADLGAAEEETVTLTQKLETTLRRLRDEMGHYEAMARELVSQDEGAARQYLERRQSTAEQATNLEARVIELKKDQERLHSLMADLEIKILDLTALSHRDRLLQLESEMKGLNRNSRTP